MNECTYMNEMNGLHEWVRHLIKKQMRVMYVFIVYIKKNMYNILVNWCLTHQLVNKYVIHFKRKDEKKKQKK